MFIFYTRTVSRLFAGILVLGACASMIPSQVHATPTPDDDKGYITAVFPERFPPIYNVTVNNLPTGFGIEIMEAVAARAKLQVNYISVSSWDEALQYLKDGRADVIPNLGITDARREFAQFTKPVEKIPVSLFVTRNNKNIGQLSDLRNTHYIVGVVESNIGVNLLKSEPSIRSRKYERVSDAIIDLTLDKIDALVYPQPVIEYVSNSLELKNHPIKVGEPLVVINRAIAVRKNDTKLLMTLNSAVDEVLQSSDYDVIYNRWHKIPAFWTNARVGYLTLALFLVVLIFAIYFRFKVLHKINTELQKSNAFINTLLDVSLEGIITIDRSGVIRSANRGAIDIFKKSEKQLVGHDVTAFMPSAEAGNFVRELDRLSVNARHMRLSEKFHQYYAKNNDGGIFPIRIGVDSSLIGGENIYVCTIQDVSRLEEAEQRATFYADHDPLTGIHNYKSLSVILENLLLQATRHKRSLSCLHIDIDRLHAINSTYGYNVGNSVILELSRRIGETLRKSDVFSTDSYTIFARAGGNRFVIVLPETDKTGAIKAARRILSSIEENPFELEDKKIEVTCKIGISCYPDDGASSEELLTHSETAVRFAKVHNHDAIHVFSHTENTGLIETDNWIHKIIEGIRENRFVLYFQPILDITNDKVSHYEALVRYVDINNNIIPPNEFIPIAEKHGLIKQLDKRVIQLAISHLAGLEFKGMDCGISVNLSGVNIGDPELFLWLETIVSENSINPYNLVFEITETASMQNAVRASAFVDSIKALGCRIALDDFGVGLSSFSYLRNFPVDLLKIDGSFISNLPESKEDQVLVKSIVDVAHSLNKKVVAEFVSSKEIFDMITKFGVDYAQGYFIGKPLPLDEYMQSKPVHDI